MEFLEIIEYTSLTKFKDTKTDLQSLGDKELKAFTKEI